MTASNMDEIIAKIQKILARTTEKGASEEEAASAMRIAQTLMSKYNLDMAAIEAAESNSASQTSVERVKGAFVGRARYKWQRRLAKYVADANFCYYLIARKVQHIFVGRRANVIAAQMMLMYLTEAVETNLPIAEGATRLSRASNSWREGCADRLCERLATKRQDLIDAHDAKAKAIDAAIREAAAKKHAAQPQQLEGNREVEVKARIASIADDAFNATGDVEHVETEQPDVDSSDVWNPADAENASVESTSTAMVLASEYSKAEEEANYEVAHNMKPGTLARWRAEREERLRVEAEKEAKEQMNKIDAPVREETARQRASRERREREEMLRRRRRWAREDAAEERRALREWEKRDHAAYSAGAKVGERIGLDTQVEGGSDRKPLRTKTL